MSTNNESQKRDRLLLKCLRELCMKKPSTPIREAFHISLLETARKFSKQ